MIWVLWGEFRIVKCRPVNIEESLSRLIANLNRQNYSSERTLFIVFQQGLLFYNKKKYRIRMYPTIFPVYFFSPSIRFWLKLDCKLTSNTLLLFHTRHHTQHPPGDPVENLCAINCPFSVFMLTITGTFSTDIPVSTLYSSSVSRTSRSFCSLLSIWSSQWFKDTGSGRHTEPDTTWPSHPGMKWSLMKSSSSVQYQHVSRLVTESEQILVHT